MLTLIGATVACPLRSPWLPTACPRSVSSGFASGYASLQGATFRQHLKRTTVE